MALAAGVQRPALTDPDLCSAPIADNVIVFQGALIMEDTSGNVRPAANGGIGAGFCCGVAMPQSYDTDRYDNTVVGHAAGNLTVRYKQGAFGFLNDGTNPILAATPPGTPVYALDDQTVSLSSGGGVRPFAGRLRGLDTSSIGGNVIVEVSKVIGATLMGSHQQIASALDVASLGASTTLLTQTTPVSGLYRVTIIVSAHTNSDTVTATVTYTDADEAFATTLTPISAVVLTHDSNTGTTSASVVVRASAATSLVATLSVTGQTTTKASAIFERLVTA